MENEEKKEVKVEPQVIFGLRVEYGGLPIKINWLTPFFCNDTRALHVNQG